MIVNQVKRCKGKKKEEQRSIGQGKIKNWVRREEGKSDKATPIAKGRNKNSGNNEADNGCHERPTGKKYGAGEGVRNR